MVSAVFVGDWELIHTFLLQPSAPNFTHLVVYFSISIMLPKFPKSNFACFRPVCSHPGHWMPPEETAPVLCRDAHADEKVNALPKCRHSLSLPLSYLLLSLPPFQSSPFHPHCTVNKLFLDKNTSSIFRPMTKLTDQLCVLPQCGFEGVTSSPQKPLPDSPDGFEIAMTDPRLCSVVPIVHA